MTPLAMPRPSQHRSVNWTEFLRLATAAKLDDAEIEGRVSKLTGEHVRVGAEWLKVVGKVPARKR